MKNNYDDILIASIYDHDNPSGPDHEFYRKLANDTHAGSIVDLGCGTGIFTTTLVAEGREVIGIDPAPAMLEIGRKRPNGDLVTWIEGTGRQIVSNSADIVFMTGNVAMHIIGSDWHETLKYIAQGLKTGGLLAFETRNPKARDWENWQEENELRDTPVGRLRETTLIDPPDEHGVVTMHLYNEFLDHDYKINTEQKLQFRTYEQVVRDLKDVGLSVRSCYRNWAGERFEGTSKELIMIFVATKD